MEYVTWFDRVPGTDNVLVTCGDGVLRLLSFSGKVCALRGFEIAAWPSAIITTVARMRAHSCCRVSGPQGLASLLLRAYLETAGTLSTPFSHTTRMDLLLCGTSPLRSVPTFLRYIYCPSQLGTVYVWKIGDPVVECDDDGSHRVPMEKEGTSRSTSNHCFTIGGHDGIQVTAVALSDDDTVRVVCAGFGNRRIQLTPQSHADVGHC
mgnify:CR=1 FL=1